MSAAMVMAVSTAAALIASSSATASTGSTSTTVVSIPKGAPTDIRQAQADLSKLDTVLADLKDQQKTAKSDLAKLEKDVKDGALDREPGGRVKLEHADEVSAAIAEMFTRYAQEYAVISAQAAALHEQFVNSVAAAAAAYITQPRDAP